MGIPITNGLNVNAPFPADLRTHVGTGMPYASKEAMALAEEDYLFDGLQVHDNDTHITYEYVIENNNMSVCTVTSDVWKSDEHYFKNEKRKIIYYEYESKYPHAGSGKRIQF